MNNTFNLTRFKFVFIKTIVERPTQIAGSFVLSFSVVLLLYFFLKNLGSFEIAQLFSFSVGLIGGGCFLASQVFGYFSDGASGASYLTLPASTLEKWFCSIIIVGIFYLGSFLLFFRGMDALFVHLYHIGLNKQDPRYMFQYNEVYVFDYPNAWPLFIFFMNSVCAMLVGSLYFNKISFIKVALVICGLYFFTFLLNYLINSMLFKDLVHTYPFHTVDIKTGTEQGIVIIPGYIDRAFDFATVYIVPPILLFISYIRLKEKEV
ncbi:MAG TPA: hypothetical protein VK772_15820 [Puia sp.]|jgi:hypothetical protein|nr:hypothetical protein [Puia sp.]